MDVYEYAIIRIVPKVERGECINVGIIMYCRDQNFIRSKVNIDKSKLLIFSPDIDCEMVEKALQSFELITLGVKDGGPIATLDNASRFRWLTANRSTILQCSKVHPGLTKDANVTFEQLFSQMVT